MKQVRVRNEPVSDTPFVAASSHATPQAPYDGLPVMASLGNKRERDQYKTFFPDKMRRGEDPPWKESQVTLAFFNALVATVDGVLPLAVNSLSQSPGVFDGRTRRLLERKLTAIGEFRTLTTILHEATRSSYDGHFGAIHGYENSNPGWTTS